MRKLFIRGGMKIKDTLTSQRGNILILSIFILMGITVLFAGMTEVGRVMIAREQLQTAADAASLAAAGSGTHRQVTIKVITDRGYQIHVDKDGNSSCNRCGTVTRGPFKGDEKDLIDNGEWQDYCVDPCSGCGGNDCWFELVDREMMYDNQFMGSKMTDGQLNSALNENAYYAKESLVWSVSNNRSKLNSMIRDKSLNDILSMLKSQHKWIQNWLIDSRYPPDCDYNCDQYLSRYTGEILAGKAEAYMECKHKTFICQQYAGKGAEFWSQYATRLQGKVERSIARDDRMKATNARRADPSGLITAVIGGEFFEINLPKHAELSYISNAHTYDITQKGSPYYPSVVIYAVSEIKTLFPQWFGDSDWKTSVCSQSATSFRDVDDQIAQTGYNRFYSSSQYRDKGRWNRVPDDACTDY